MDELTWWWAGLAGWLSELAVSGVVMTVLLLLLRFPRLHWLYWLSRRQRQQVRMWVPGAGLIVAGSWLLWPFLSGPATAPAVPVPQARCLPADAGWPQPGVTWHPGHQHIVVTTDAQGRVTVVPPLTGVSPVPPLCAGHPGPVIRQYHTGMPAD